MGGTKRLTWITGVTLAGLLLTSSAVTALADEHRHRGQGDDHGRALGLVSHAADQKDVEDRQHGRDADDDDRLERALVTSPAVVTSPGVVTPPGSVEDRERPGWGCGDDEHEHLGPPGNPDASSPCDKHDHESDDDHADGGDD